MPSSSRLAVITTAYDTNFAPVTGMVSAKRAQLAALEAETILFVAAPSSQFADAVRRSQGEVPVVVVDAPGASKGRALRLAMAAALKTPCDLIAYLNLNLKVDAASLAPALEALTDRSVGAVVGTRAASEGGQHLGQGQLGTLKSRGFNEVARRLFPTLGGYADTNAPLKVMRREFAERILNRGRIDGIAFDCEWLLILHATNCRIEKVAITWRQLPGSRPPYTLVPKVLVDLLRTRRLADTGAYASA